MIVVCSFLIVKIPWLNEDLTKAMNADVNKYGLLQQEQKCCGVVDYKDWLQMTSTDYTFPRSCCVDDKLFPPIPCGDAIHSLYELMESQVGYQNAKDDIKNSIYLEGCSKKIIPKLWNLVLIDVALVILLLLQVVFSACYYRSINDIFD